MDGGSAIVLNVPMDAKRATKSTLTTPKQVVNGRQKRGQRIEGRTASQNRHERPRATGRPWCGRGVVGGGQRRGEGEVGDEVVKPRRGREMEGRGAKERRREGRSQRARAQGHGRDQCLCPLAVGANAKPTEPYC